MKGARWDRVSFFLLLWLFLSLCLFALVLSRVKISPEQSGEVIFTRPGTHRIAYTTGKDPVDPEEVVVVLRSGDEILVNRETGEVTREEPAR